MASHNISIILSNLSSGTSKASTSAPKPDLGLQQAWFVVSCIVTAVGFCLTSAILATYAVNRSFGKNLFHIYVKNLLAAGWLFFSFFSPVSLYIGSDPMRNYPSYLCSLNDYVSFVFGTLPATAHVSISFNRVYAMAFPTSYREKHSEKMAIRLCVGGATFIHIIALPIVAVEYTRYGSNRAAGCQPDVMDPSVGILLLVNMVAIYVFEALIVGLYPYVWWKNRVRRRMKIAMSHAPRSGLNSSDKGGVSRNPAEKTGVTVDSHERKAASHAFTALTMLTTTVLLFWTPLLSYVAVCSLTGTFYDPVLFSWLTLLQRVQTMCDPMIFLFSLKDLRKAVLRMIRCNLAGNQ